MRICFVCLGNICRSPTAEGIFRHRLRERGLEGEVTVDSAGTAAYHVGKSPDRRAAAEASQRGIELSGKARQFSPEDFENFDYVIAMDEMNASDLAAIAPTKAARDKIRMFRSFEGRGSGSHSAAAGVPDPYYGGQRGFQEVFEICESASEGLLDHIQREHGLRGA